MEEGEVWQWVRVGRAFYRVESGVWEYHAMDAWVTVLNLYWANRF